MQMIPGVDVGLFYIDDSVLAAHGITDLEECQSSAPFTEVRQDAGLH